MKKLAILGIMVLLLATAVSAEVTINKIVDGAYSPEAIAKIISELKAEPSPSETTSNIGAHVKRNSWTYAIIGIVLALSVMGAVGYRKYKRGTLPWQRGNHLQRALNRLREIENQLADENHPEIIEALLRERAAILRDFALAELEHHMGETHVFITGSFALNEGPPPQDVLDSIEKVFWSNNFPAHMWSPTANQFHIMIDRGSLPAVETDEDAQIVSGVTEISKNMFILFHRERELRRVPGEKIKIRNVRRFVLRGITIELSPLLGGIPPYAGYGGYAGTPPPGVVHSGYTGYTGAP